MTFQLHLTKTCKKDGEKNEFLTFKIICTIFLIFPIIKKKSEKRYVHNDKSKGEVVWQKATRTCELKIRE